MSEPQAGAAMEPLHPSYLWVLRIRVALTAAAFLAGAIVMDVGPLRETPVPPAMVPVLVGLIGLAAVLVLPKRRYRRWAYRQAEDELHLRHGLWVRVRTIVPFGRVQHIDTAQGPLERHFGVASLILHTAGTRGASVSLPGLALAEAERLRDHIRAKIRQDLG